MFPKELMSYFNHRFASNSDIKELVARHHGKTKPENIQEIFAFGTEFHAGILETHKVNWNNIDASQADLIMAMSKTFWKDELCRKIVMAPDFKREHEFYRSERFGIGARCKCDGVSKKLRVILELKGLSVATERAFKDSVLHLDYDQGAAWYLNVATGRYFVLPDNKSIFPANALIFDYKLIVGISKKNPDLLFKMLIDRNHPYYKSGMEKVKYGINLWKNVYGFN